MRVSEKAHFNAAKTRIEKAKNQNSTALDKLSSQKQISKVSDDPVGSMAIVKLRDRIKNVRQNQRNINYSQAFIDTSSIALEGITNDLIRARELSVAMANDTYDSKSRDATSKEVKQLIDSVIAQANTEYNGHYIFGGFRNSNPPVAIDGTFSGDDGVIFVPVTNSRFQKINIKGRELFNASDDELKKGHFGMIESLKLLYDGLQANDKNMIFKSMNELDNQLDKTSTFQATIGSISNSMSSVKENLDSQEITLKKNLSEVQDVDVYDATSEFKRSEAVLESTLRASNKLLQPSLLNYLQ